MVVSLGAAVPGQGNRKRPLLAFVVGAFFIAIPGPSVAQTDRESRDNCLVESESVGAADAEASKANVSNSESTFKLSSLRHLRPANR